MPFLEAQRPPRKAEESSRCGRWTVQSGRSRGTGVLGGPSVLGQHEPGHGGVEACAAPVGAVRKIPSAKVRCRQDRAVL